MKTTSILKFSKFWHTRKEAECVLNLLRSALNSDITVGIERNTEWGETWHVFYNKNNVKRYLMPEPSTPCGMCIPLGIASSCDGCHNNIPIQF